MTGAVRAFEAGQMGISPETIQLLRDGLIDLLCESSVDPIEDVTSLKIYQTLSLPVLRKYQIDSDLTQKMREEFQSFVLGFDSQLDQELLQSLYILSLHLHPFELKETATKIFQRWGTHEAIFKYLFSFPHSFSERSESDSFCQFQRSNLRLLLSELRSPSLNLERRAHLIRLSNLYVQGPCAMGNDENLRENMILLRELGDFLTEPKSIPAWVSKNILRANSKIRIGGLRHSGGSGDANYVLQTLLHLNPEKFELTLYQLAQQEMRETSTFKIVDFPVDLKTIPAGSLASAVQFLRDENLDILFNLSYVSSPITGLQGQILQARVAPLQVLTLSEIHTTGLKAIDYFIVGDRYRSEALEAELVETPHYIEGTGIRTPHPFIGPKTKAEKMKLREKLELPLDACLLVSNAHHFKLTPQTLDTWIKILADNPGADLVSMPYVFDETEFDDLVMKQNLEHALSKYGVSANRVHFRKIRGKAVWEVMSASDIYLDSFPYGGPTSTMEALLFALPPVTKSGRHIRSKYVGGIFSDLGLSSQVAHSEAEYVEIASKLIGSEELRNQIVDFISKTLPNHSLMNREAGVKQLESTLEHLKSLTSGYPVAHRRDHVPTEQTDRNLPVS
ncbi:MAG: Methyltransferase type 11 [Bacteriovoracaceae bacterium]|nr:Methyltransferase type 11 [Bacteriovoracaceae bacterium]